ncbi:MAG: hypothetical protein ACC628_27945, partial [Pirellulaceae bacterium]
MVHVLVGFLGVTLWFAGTNADAQSISSYEPAARGEPRIGGQYLTSPMLSSAVPDQWGVASGGTPSQQAAGRTRDYNVIAGTDSTAAHGGASPWILLEDRV